MTGFCEACLRLDREEERAFVDATIGVVLPERDGNLQLSILGD